MRRLHALALAGLLACRPQLHASPSFPPPIEVAPPEPPPATFVYHPPAPTEIFDLHRLDEGVWVYVRARGERWLQEGAEAWARTAANRPAEDLVTVRPWGGEQGRFVFLGSQGGVYFAEEPLGPLTAAVPAPRRLAALVRQGDGLLGVDELGDLQRFEAGAWRRVHSGVRLFDLVPDRGGLVGLGLPESLWRSEDGGSTWQRLPATPVGNMRMTPSPDGLVVVGGQSLHRLDDGGQLQPIPDPHLRSRGPRVARGPSGAAIVNRRAALDGDRYVELMKRRNAEPADALIVGTLGEPMTERPLEISGGCKGGVVAHRGDHVWIVCTGRGRRWHMPAGPHRRDPPPPTPLVLYHTTGNEPEPALAIASTYPDRIGLAVHPSGRVLVTAACVDEAVPCLSHPPFWVEPDGGHRVVQASGLTGPSFSPVVDGDAVYFLGEVKDAGTGLYIGASQRPFRMVPLEPTEPERSHRRPPSRDLSIDAEGQLGIRVEGQGKDPSGYELWSADGRRLAVAKLPEHTVMIGGAGAHVLVARHDPADGDAVELAESNDGGVSFHPLATPMHLDTEDLKSPFDPVRGSLGCSESGCVIGESHTRLGWEPDDQAEVVATRPPPPGDPEVRRLATCSFAGPEQRIDHVRGTLPDAWGSFKGSVMWSVLRHDGRRLELVGAVDRGGSEAAHELERTTLLTARGTDVERIFSVVVDGGFYAAQKVEDAPGSPIELVWANEQLDQLVRADFVPERGNLDAMYWRSGDSLVLPLDRDSLAIALGGSRPARQVPTPALVPSHFQWVWRSVFDIDGQIVLEMHYRGLGGRSRAGSLVALRRLGGDPVFWVKSRPGSDNVVLLEGALEGRPATLTLLSDGAFIRRGFATVMQPDASFGPAVWFEVEPGPPPPCDAAAQRAGLRRDVELAHRPVVAIVADDGKLSELDAETEVQYWQVGRGCTAGWWAEAWKEVAVVEGSTQRGWHLRSLEGSAIAVRPLACGATTASPPP